MPFRLPLAAVVLSLLAACQTDTAYVNDAEYHCERIQRFDPGSTPFRECVYYYQLERRDRYP